MQGEKGKAKGRERESERTEVKRRENEMDLMEGSRKEKDEGKLRKVSERKGDN